MARQKKVVGASTPTTKKNNQSKKTCIETILKTFDDFVNFKFLKHSVCLKAGTTKEQLRSNFKINRNDWKRQTGLEAFIKSIQCGYIHQAEVSVNGELEYHFGVIDFDFWDKTANAPIANAITIEQIKQLPSILKYGYALQQSISYREAAQNCHVYLVFDQPLHSKEEFQKCLKAVVENVKRDIAALLGLEYNNALELGVDGCTANNPAQVTFASLELVSVMESIANTEKLLKLADMYDVRTSRSAKSTPPESKPEVVQTVTATGTITDRVLAFLHDELFLKAFNGDAGALYSIHNPDQRWTARTDLEVGEECRLEGFNPFSGTNNSGSSFMVIHEAGKLPRFWDKSGSFERLLRDGFSSNHGTFLDYYFHIFSDEFPGIELNNGQFPDGFFKVLVDHICDHFGINGFDWEAGRTEVNVVINQCLDYLKKHAKHLGNDTWFYFNGGTWQIVYDFSHIYCDLGKPWIIENYGDNVFKRKGKQTLTITTNDSCYKSELMRLLKDDRTYNYNDLPDENFRYVPVNNGLYDLRDRKLVDNNGQAYNFFKFPYDVSPESSVRGEIAAKALLQYFTELFESNIYATVIYNYFMLHCSRQAFDSEILPCIVGASGKGKTTVLMLLKKLINGIDETTLHKSKRSANNRGFCIQPEKDNLLSGYTHATEELEGKSCVLIPEITNNTTHVSKDVMSFFKAFAGNQSDNTLKINPKGKKTRNRSHRMGFVLDNEKIPNINSSIDGNFRRLFFLEVKDSSPGCESFHDKWMNLIEPHLEDIFNYALTLNAEDLIASIKSLKQEQIVIDLVTLVRETNDSVLEFVRDHIEVTNNPEDVVSMDALYNVFEQTNSNGKYASRSTKKRFLINQIVERLKDKNYNLGWTGEQTSTDVVSRCKIVNKSVRGSLTGIRLTENALLSIGRHDLYVQIKPIPPESKEVVDLQVVIKETKIEAEKPNLTPVNEAIADKKIEYTEKDVTIETTVKEFVSNFTGTDKQLNSILTKLNQEKNYKSTKILVKFVYHTDVLPEM